MSFAWYLTIRESRNNIYYLDYPNYETKLVMTEFFIWLLKSQYDFSLLVKIIDFKE